MTIIKHELKQGLKTVLIWTLAIAFLLVVCVFLFPEMKGQTEELNEMLSSLGSFSTAFGMDRLNYGTLIGFYAIECGNILGLGGAFFAALIAAAMLAKEEKDRTAEFLLSHPVRRFRVVSEKLAAVMIEIVGLNGVITLAAVASMAAIGETIPWKELMLLHLAYLLMQIELAGICFGISAFVRRGSVGIGIGIAAVMYFLNIIGNITDRAEFLKYITPFGYTEGADIVANGSLDTVLVLLGMTYAVIGISIGFVKYCRKDIR